MLLALSYFPVPAQSRDRSYSPETKEGQIYTIDLTRFIIEEELDAAVAEMRG